MLYLALALFCLGKGSGGEIMTSLWNDTANVTLSLRHLCPYNKFCHSSPLKEFQHSDQKSCCEECSCGSDCFETGSCCPDVPMSGLAEPKYPCKHLLSFGKNVNPIDIDRDIIDFWYHVIDDCPNKTVALSYQRCYQPEELQDYAIVTDPRRGKVYKNKHCAECNNILSYEQLKLRVNCVGSSLISLANRTSVQAAKHYIAEKCTIMSSKPDTRLALSHCSPKSHLISGCNMTGNWILYDNEIEQRCLTKGLDQNLIFKGLYSIMRGYKYFANVYCYLCNVAVSTKNIDTCDNPEKHDDSKSAFINEYGIIDLQNWEENDVTVKESVCESSQIWDPSQGMCRQVFCPHGHVPVYGRCISLFTNIYGYTCAIHFQVLIKDGRITANSLLLQYLEYRLNGEIGTDIICGKCSAGLYSKNSSTSHIFFRYVMFSKEGCRYDVLLDRLRNIAVKKEIVLQFRYRNQNVRIALILLYDKTHITTDYTLLSDSLQSFCLSKEETIDASILLYCPSIMLSRKEILNLGLRNVSDATGDASQQSNDRQAELEQICVDTYFSATSSATRWYFCLTCYAMYEWFAITLMMFSLKQTLVRE